MSSFDIHFVDPELCKTLVELQALARRRKVISESQSDVRAAKCDLSFRGTKIEDLCLDFSLPGYTDYVLSPRFANDMVRFVNKPLSYFSCTLWINIYAPFDYR